MPVLSLCVALDVTPPQASWGSVSPLGRKRRHDRRRLPLLSTSYMPSSVTVLFLGGLGPASHCSLSVLPPLLF